MLKVFWYLADFTVLKSHIRCCIKNKGLKMITPKFHIFVKELVKVIKVHIYFLVKRLMKSSGDREDWWCVQGFVNNVQKQLNKNCDRERVVFHVIKSSINSKQVTIIPETKSLTWHQCPIRLYPLWNRHHPGSCSDAHMFVELPRKKQKKGTAALALW